MKFLNKLRPSCFVLFILAASIMPVSLQADVALPGVVSGFATAEGFAGYFESGGGHRLVRHNNNLYAVFSDYSVTDTGKLIFAKSSNNGINWTSQPIDETTGANTYISGASITVSANGSIYISYLICTGNVNEHKLKVLKTTNEGQSWITANVYDTVSKKEGLYSDLIISEAGLIVVALSRINWDMTGIASINIFTNIESNFNTTPFSEESYNDFSYAANYNSDTLYLSKDKQGNVFLAADYYHNNNYDKAVRVFKRTASSGSWSLFAPSTSAYTYGQHPAIVNDPSGDLHLVYSVTPNGSGSMDLMYRKYNGNNGTEITSNKLLSAPKIYTPQIGLAANTDAPGDVIPVIQFVSGNSGGSAYNIIQINQQSDSAWSVPTASITSGNQAVFLYTLPEVIDDKPDMLWYNNTSKTVYYNRAPDIIAPWQPAAPTVRWTDQGLNSGNTQKVSASMTVLPANSTQVYYDWGGSRVDIPDSAYAANVLDNKNDVGDRQQISVKIKARDTAGNESLFSPSSSVLIIPDRTSPGGSVIINSGNPVYTNTTNVSLQLAYQDDTNNASGQSGVNKVTVGGDVTAPGDTALSTAVNAATGALAKVLTAANGQKTVTVSYTDVSSNTSALASDTIYLDTVTPTITSTGELRNSNQADPAAASWTADDPQSNSYASGVSTYNIYWGTDTSATAGNQTPTTSANFDPSTISTQGTYYLRVQPVDRAGNTGGWFTVLTYTYSTTAPFDAGVTINNGAEYTNSQNVFLTLKATNAASMNISNTNPGSAPTTGWVDYQEYNNNYAWTLIGGDGQKTVYVWYKSSNGSDTLTQDSITLDATVPTFPHQNNPDPSDLNNYFGVLINGGAVWTNTLNVTLNLSATSGTAPIVSVNISNDGSNWSGWQSYVTVKQNWPLLDNSSVTKTVYAQFQDAAGNISAVVTDDILLDTVPPAPGLIDPGSGVSNYGILINNGDAFTNSTTVALSLNAVSTGSAVVSMNISNDINFTAGTDTSGWIAYNANYATWTLSTGEGTKTVYALFRDAAGNISATVNDTIIYTTQSLPQPIGGGVTINNGAEWTNTLYVSLNIGALNAVSFNISVYNTFPDGQYSSSTLNYTDYGTLNTAFDYAPVWQLLPGSDSVRTVYVKFIDQYGRFTIVQDTIKLDTTPPDTGLIDPGNGFSGHGVLINNGQAKTFSPTVNLTLSANPVADVAKIWLSNSPDFTNKVEINSFVSNYPNWYLGAGNGQKTVYAKFIDAAGNSVNAQDAIIVDTSLTLLDFIEPNGVNDVASNNFTLSWVDYPQLLNDPAATIALWAKETAAGVWHKISENILFLDPVNGAIWDTRALNNGTYNISAAINSIFGAVTVDALYPVYVVHSNNGGDVGPYPPGSLPSDPPAVLVIEPSRDVQAGQPIHIVWDDQNTAGDGSVITIYYDTDTNPANGRTLITANIDADDPADLYTWLADNVPEGEYYICVEISNGTHTNYDYSTGKVSVPKPTVANSSNSGDTDEPIYSYPNPVSPKKDEMAHIVFRVDKDGWAKVYIYNIRGQRIWQTDKFARAGENNEVLWDGRDVRGALSPNGIYIMLLVNEKKQISAKGRLTIYD